ncbi:hypothetical protein D7D52_11555 [Nocardia yunnanensis]|uniref:PH domain-containing protein n=1 Tax=Nocardia yunnanensis TaxID=2382165 RepID=A0A386ZMU3_9NOCA|nr:hypothetical protein [Nocardia yunnanensis]AYF78941.1 hypothetical protein D7D52_11555 [Nocardia yunnanensis]
MTDTSKPGSAGDVGLDLIAPELLAPALRKLTLAALGAGVGGGLLAALFLHWPWAVAIGLVVGAPTALYAMAVQRRRIMVSGTVIRARTWRGERRLDLAAATAVEVLVYPGKISRIVLRLTAGPDSQIVPLAIYSDSGGGRELHILGLRKLADGLAGCPLVAALAISGLLVQQLRTEARDAVAEERPLYRAVRMVRARDEAAPIILADGEIADLAR